jgi:soluble lytic murein transglycosylase-like protein
MSLVRCLGHMMSVNLERNTRLQIQKHQPQLTQLTMFSQLVYIGAGTLIGEPMLTLKRLPSASSFTISRNVFYTSPIKRSTFMLRYWWLTLALTLVFAAGTFYTYEKAVEWWNYEIYLKRQVADVDTTNPLFTNALVKWMAQKAHGVPNTNTEMLQQIVVTAFKESEAHQVDPFLTLAVITTESKFDYMAVSPAGAKGLMQVIPSWHKDKISVVEVFNPVANIKAGTQILREYLNSTNGDVHKALLMYNGSLAIPGANYDKKVLQNRAELSTFVETQIRTNYGKNI